jgi:hypothetical protein
MKHAPAAMGDRVAARAAQPGGVICEIKGRIEALCLPTRYAGDGSYRSHVCSSALLPTPGNGSYLPRA